MPQKYTYGDFRPLRRGEPGYSPTRRLYVSPSTGEVLPVSQFQRLARGGQSYKSYREQREKQGIPTKEYTSHKAAREALFSEFYQSEVKRAIENNLPVPTVKEVENSVEWQIIPTWLRSKDNSPNGKKAQALILLGRREPWWTWNVGDTPK